MQDFSMGRLIDPGEAQGSQPRLEVSCMVSFWDFDIFGCSGYGALLSPGTPGTVVLDYTFTR